MHMGIEGKGGRRVLNIYVGHTLYDYVIGMSYDLFQTTRDDVTAMTLCESSEEKTSPTKLTGT